MTDHPNIVIITTHDTGQHLGCYGIDTVHTPAIDDLADAGCRFANYFCASPVCSPSRGAMMTGRWPQSNGLMGLVHNPWLWELNEDERHLAQILREAGYNTALFNIQHETRGSDWKRLGFETYHDCKSDDHRPTCLDTARVFGEFVKNYDGERPLYAQIGFFETHTPFDFGGVEADREKGVHIPDRLAKNEAAEEHMAMFQGNVRRADEAVGRIVAALDTSGRRENSIIIYTSDHGIEAARDKWFLFEPGIRIPLVMRWISGEITGGRVYERMQSNVDLAPTVLELAGLPVPENMQGKSFMDAFGPTGNDGPVAGRDTVYLMFQGKELRGVRTRTHKLIVHFSPHRSFSLPVDIRKKATQFNVSPVIELYDLVADPNEFTNLAEGDESEKHAAVLGELLGKLWAWMEEVKDPLLSRPPWTPFYQMALNHYKTWTRGR